MPNYINFLFTDQITASQQRLDPPIVFQLLTRSSLLRRKSVNIAAKNALKLLKFLRLRLICLKLRIKFNMAQQNHQILLTFAVLSFLPDNPGDSRFWTVSPGLQIRVWNLPDNCQILQYFVHLTLRPCQGKFRQAAWPKKVATARKMKSRQETTSPSQIVTVTAKLTISDKHLSTPTRDVLKFRWTTWNLPQPPPPPQQGLNFLSMKFQIFCVVWAI